MQRPKAPELVVTLAAAALLVGSAVGLIRTRDDSGGGELAGPSAVRIADFSFGPSELTVSLGDTVTWTNADKTTHTVTGNDGDTLESDDLKPDDTYNVTFEDAGSFEYICKFHPNMHGTITVEG